jgi:hypothetical protein
MVPRIDAAAILAEFRGSGAGKCALGLGLAALRHTATYLRVFGLKREFPTENPSV